MKGGTSMEKAMILQQVQERCKKLKDGPKKKVITTIVSDKNWYKKVNFDTIVNVLHDLGYSIDEAKEIYEMLLLK